MEPRILTSPPQPAPRAVSHDVGDLEARVLFLERCNIALWAALSATLIAVMYRKRVNVAEVSAERFLIVSRVAGQRKNEVFAELSKDAEGNLALRTKGAAPVRISDQFGGPNIMLSPSKGVTWTQGARQS